MLPCDYKKSKAVSINKPCHFRILHLMPVFMVMTRVVSLWWMTMKTLVFVEMGT